MSSLHPDPAPEPLSRVRGRWWRAAATTLIGLTSTTAVLAAGSSLAPQPARVSASAATATQPTPQQRLQLALEAQSARDFATMLAQLRQAATEGDMQAQEMLGLALLVGPTLYGPAVKADRCEAGLWLRRAVAQGSEVGRVQLDFLNRLRQAPGGRDVCAAWGN